MFDSQKSSGSGYTMTVALLAFALIFVPAALFLSRPVGWVLLSFAIVASVLCLGLATLSWKKSRTA